MSTAVAQLLNTAMLLPPESRIDLVEAVLERSPVSEDFLAAQMMVVSGRMEKVEEYREAAQYSEDRFGLGVQFVNAVQTALREIESDPARFQQVGEGVRIYRMRRFPYYLFYQHQPKTGAVIIYAVAHHKRQPDYWRERIPN
jgi:mRNA-degrading endonuclease RelE of RelBE toxin-antitoxin system